MYAKNWDPSRIGLPSFLACLFDCLHEAFSIPLGKGFRGLTLLDLTRLDDSSRTYSIACLCTPWVYTISYSLVLQVEQVVICQRLPHSTL